MLLNYQEICKGLLNGLPQRQKEVLLRRFALSAGAPGESGAKRETLEAIGSSLGLTRERVRQIEKDGLLKIAPKLQKYQKVVKHFEDYLKLTGELRKEAVLLSQLGGEKQEPQVFFLLTIAEPFKRFAETDEFHSLWYINHNSFEKAKKVIDSFRKKLAGVGKPLSISDWRPPLSVSPDLVQYFLEISKVIHKSSEGLFGLKNWPEINPRNIRDKAFLVLKKAGEPLHFRDVAAKIEPEALEQTVHNELIRDQRFVLVGRGLYALREWGFKEGYVRDIIHEILAKAGSPMRKEEILEKVLSQRFVKENTILLNLNNKKYFVKDSLQRYQIKES